MDEKVKVYINKSETLVEKDAKLKDIAKTYCPGACIMLSRVNGRLRELFHTVEPDSDIEFIGLDDNNGMKTYERGLQMVFMKALYRVVGKKNIKRASFEYGLGRTVYCDTEGFEVNDELIGALRAEMQKIVDEDIPIVKKTVSTSRAREIFGKVGMKDKEKLLRFRIASNTNIYYLGEFVDYFYGYMPAETGCLKVFDVKKYMSGILLVLPDIKDPSVTGQGDERVKLFNTLDESNKRSEAMGISTVGDLNEYVSKNNSSDLILLAEALQEKKLSEIASMVKKEGGKKFVMIAGPSSSGKTTFSHRLSIHLRLEGFKPHPIGLDNYYKDRQFCPKDEDGNYDFECLEALDVELFNKDMTRLLNGEEVDMPTFNFKTGKREYKGDKLRLEKDDILVIEGIHGINPNLSYSLPDESKFKVYISALTQLNVDEHNRIPTTDGRLLRRMVRDARTRGTAAKDTIAMWPSVRRGEENYIFPYQESADVMFNSALLYELAVIKPFAEPLLFGIGPECKEYETAKSLLKFLSYFLTISPEDIPRHSIMREFIGGSIFNV
ncbi:MAG: nucleoside kinase [Lachnospiraceae bacterium]|nr:nucleoside kinase [Lachnospiraceae bacterium]